MKISLSDSEWKLMHLLWEKSPRTIMELTALVKQDIGWGKNTVITMLSRLESKRAVRYEMNGRARQYFPVIQREDTAITETDSFLEKVYGRSLGLMVNTMLKNHALTPNDIAELSDILQKAKEGKQ
jgi:BlaI family penicillinase repressor